MSALQVTGAERHLAGIASEGMSRPSGGRCHSGHGLGESDARGAVLNDEQGGGLLLRIVPKSDVARCLISRLRCKKETCIRCGEWSAEIRTVEGQYWPKESEIRSNRLTLQQSTGPRPPLTPTSDVPSVSCRQSSRPSPLDRVPVQVPVPTTIT